METYFLRDWANIDRKSYCFTARPDSSGSDGSEIENGAERRDDGVGAVNDGSIPGEVLTGEGSVTLNEGRETTTVRVANTGDRPVQVGSHFHFFEANAALAFDRGAAFGMRLDVPAGTAVRFEPGDETDVSLVRLGGERLARGMNGLTDGSTDEGSEAAAARAREAGFLDTGPEEGEPDETADGDPGDAG